MAVPVENDTLPKTVAKIGDDYKAGDVKDDAAFKVDDLTAEKDEDVEKRSPVVKVTTTSTPVKKPATTPTPTANPRKGLGSACTVM